METYCWLALLVNGQFRRPGLCAQAVGGGLVGRQLWFSDESALEVAPPDRRPDSWPTAFTTMHYINRRSLPFTFLPSSILTICYASLNCIIILSYKNSTNIFTLAVVGYFDIRSHIFSHLGPTFSKVPKIFPKIFPSLVTCDCLRKIPIQILNAVPTHSKSGSALSEIFA